MTAHEIKSFLKKIPFEPFTLVMSNNERYDVYHPEMLLVGYGMCTLGLAKPGDPDLIADRFVHLSVDHILKIEPTAKAKATGK
jgi:hypothetical protein